MAGIDTLKHTENHIQYLSGFQPIQYDRCLNFCICYVGQYEALTECPMCFLKCHAADNTPLPISHTFQSSPASMLWLLILYMQLSPSTKQNTSMIHYHALLTTDVVVGSERLLFWFFSDPQDIELELSTDGFRLFKHHTKTAWSIILFNYNLPPEERFQKDNIILMGIIPWTEEAW